LVEQFSHETSQHETAQNNNDSPADMFLQLQCRLNLIFFLKIRQVLTNVAAALDTHCQLIALLSTILFWF
jgi:hypothetical protein